MKLGINLECGNLRRLILSLSIAGIFCLSILQSFIPNASAAEETKTFYIGLNEAVTSANPFVGIYDSDYLFFSYVYDYLIFPDENGIPTPNLARSWWHMNGLTAASLGSDFSALPYYKNASNWPSGSIWEYNLTENVFWNDGEPFTADDVVFTIRFQTGPGYINVWAYQPYTKWIEYCEKINDYKVRIFFSDHITHAPVPIAWGTSLLLPIMPNHIFDKFSSPVYIVQNWTGVPAIGTGPFKGGSTLVQEMIAKESITLVKNPYYDFDDNGTRMGLGGIYNRTNLIDKLVMKFYAEEQTLIVDLKTKKLDVAKVTATNYLALQQNRPEELTLVSPYSPTVYSKISHFNVWEGASMSLNPARLDPALLRATAIATNKSYICETIFKGLATPGVGILSPVWPQHYWSPPHDETSIFNITDGSGDIKWNYTKPLDEVMEFDPDLANEILDQAGYIWTDATHTLRKIGPDAANRLVNLGFIGDPAAALGKTLEFEDVYEIEVYEDKDISQYLSNEWAQIGVKLTQKPVNIGVWNQLVYGFQAQFAETYWSGDPDPNYLLYIPTSYAMDGWNEFGTMNATYDHYYDMQANTMNSAERKYWIDKCQEWQYLSGGAMIVTCYPKTCFAYNDQPGPNGKWTGWGNWTQHPGLAIDHYWGETPLFYHIKWQYDVPQPPPPPPFPTLIVAVIGASAAVGAFAIIVAVKATKMRKMKGI